MRAHPISLQRDRCALSPTPVHPRIERLCCTMHDIHVHQTELAVAKAHLDGRQLRWVPYEHGVQHRRRGRKRWRWRFCWCLVCQWVRRCGWGHVGCYRKRWGEWRGIVKKYTMLGTRDIVTRLVRINNHGNLRIRSYKRGTFSQRNQGNVNIKTGAPVYKAHIPKFLVFTKRLIREELVDDNRPCVR